MSHSFVEDSRRRLLRIPGGHRSAWEAKEEVVMGPRTATRRSGWRTFALVLAAAMALATQARAQGVSARLRGTSPTVAPGATFTVYLEVGAGGPAFNGFDATIGYDPAALTLLPPSASSLPGGSHLVRG